MNYSNKSLRILIAEDSREDVLTLERHLRKNGYSPNYEVVKTAPEMKEALGKGDWDILISNCSIPGFKAPDVLKAFRESEADIPFLFVSGGIGEDAAVAAMKAGADDFILKNNLARLVPAIERALQEAKERQGRKRAEEHVERLRKENELILRSAGEGIYGLDTEGNTTFVNPAAAEILGWKQDDLIGKLQHKLIHHTKHDGREYPREECPIYAAFSDGEIHTVDDEVFWRKDGTSLPVEYTSTPIRDDDGKLAGAVVTFRDITLRKKAKKDLLDALAQIKDLKDKLEAENVYLQEEIKLEHNFDEIIGASESFRKVLGNVEMVAETDSTVLILGETGTGKELIARALHKLSPRKERALVKVNCAALPSELIESELFGHEKGAFTSAMSRREGRFELADGGTIFLDEIADLPLEQQAKLLRVLQEGEFERVGGVKTLKIDVRVIAATNADLKEAVAAGEFREDLFYRLNVFPIDLPPLRDRREDIPLLVRHFINKFGAKFGKEITDIPRSVMDSLQAYSFQGNIRELENIIERALIVTQDNTLRLGEDLSPLKTETPSADNKGTLEEVERKYITAVLHDSNWRIEGANGAAPRLGLKPSTLRSRMEKLGIKRPGGG